jgi:alkyl sulfatase BDS1-like metallo-beta-lactamase superfamily hydrolase
MTLNWVLTDRDAAFAMTLRNGVLTYRRGMRHAKADVEITLGADRLAAVSQGQVVLAAAVARGEVQVSGRADKAAALIGMLTTFDPAFDIVTP